MGPGVVLDAAGLRELHRLVAGLRGANRWRLRAGTRK